MPTLAEWCNYHKRDISIRAENTEKDKRIHCTVIFAYVDFVKADDELYYKF